MTLRGCERPNRSAKRQTRSSSLQPLIYQQWFTKLAYDQIQLHQTLSAMKKTKKQYHNMFTLMYSHSHHSLNQYAHTSTHLRSN